MREMMWYMVLLTFIPTFSGCPDTQTSLDTIDVDVAPDIGIDVGVDTPVDVSSADEGSPDNISVDDEGSPDNISGDVDATQDEGSELLTPPGELYGTQCREHDQLYFEPPAETPACTACVTLRTEVQAAKFEESTLEAPLFQRVPEYEEVLNSVEPKTGYDINPVRIITAPVTGGDKEDILLVAETDKPLSAFTLLQVSADGEIGMPDPLNAFLDAHWCIASVDLGGPGPEKELICIQEDEIIIYHGSDSGVYSEDAAFRLPMNFTNGGGLPDTATTVDFSGDGRPEVILTRGGATNIVLCQMDDLDFENCTSFIGMQIYEEGELKLLEGLTFFNAPFPCNPAELELSDICLFEANDDGKSTPNVTWRVVRSEADPYGFHLERFDPTDQPGAEPDACDRISVSSCPDWLSLDQPCPGWLYDNLWNALPPNVKEEGDALLVTGALDGFNSDPMGFGCSVFGGGQLCCALSETAGPLPDVMVCHQEDNTWRMVHSIGLTKRLSTHGHTTKGWGVAWVSTGRWDKDLIVANGEEVIDSSLFIFRNILGGLLPGYEEYDTFGPAYIGYYRRLPNLALDEQSETIGLTASSGQYANISPIWLPKGEVLTQHLFFGKWQAGYDVYRLDKPEGNFVRLRLYGDNGSDRTGMLARVTVTDGEHKCTSFLGTESAQPHLGHSRDVTCGVGDAETVSVSVQWFPSNKYLGGHISDYTDVPADGVMSILHESGGWTRDPKAL